MGMRLITLTGYGRDSDEQRAMTAGFDAHHRRTGERGRARDEPREADAVRERARLVRLTIPRDRDAASVVATRVR